MEECSKRGESEKNNDFDLSAPALRFSADDYPNSKLMGAGSPDDSGGKDQCPTEQG